MAAAEDIPATVGERRVTAADGHRAMAAVDRPQAAAVTPRPATGAGDRHTVVVADRMVAAATAAIARRNSGSFAACHMFGRNWRGAETMSLFQGGTHLLRVPLFFVRRNLPPGVCSKFSRKLS